MAEMHTLPDNPVYAFTPSYEFEDQVQQIRIVFQDMPGYVSTAMVALTVQDAENICDKLNRRLGLPRDAWTALVARSMAPSRPPSGMN